MATKVEDSKIANDDLSSETYDYLDNERVEDSGEVATNFIDKIGLRFNAEIRGIQRVPEDKRVDTSLLSPLCMFLSPNLAISALSTGALGPTVFALDFRTCVLVIVFWCIIGALPVGFYSAFGMRFGLRQQILSRYFTGNIMGRVFALFNVISCIGWNAINIIPCVQLLTSVGPIPAWAGCLVFVVITCLLAMFGYRTIHLYERYSWIPNFAIYLIIIAKFTQSHSFTWGKMETGTIEAGNVLSFMSTIFGFIAGWSPSAADYTVYMPATTPAWKVGTAMVIGLSVPAIFAATLGAAIAMGTFTNDAFAAAFESNSVGGLVYEILCGNNTNQGYRFVVVLLALSGIANNLPGSYSLSVSIQCTWSYCAKIPRLLWCFAGNFLSLALSIPAYYVFEAAMSNFLSIIGYNVSIYLGISLTEHFIYRKGFKGYDVSNFNDRKTLPVGIAGVVAFAFGVASTVLSMNQTWYQGVIARKFGEYGGDISFELNILFAFVGYNLVRPFEKKYFGR
ncbi:permease for cytosine/purines, uracil, thiamine, allantoin-domain-containing protein [Scheffersomyces xylosifermentans]|uniref:permease for cytosine/purines, uracil, thiamine, allantoin-domain-containing protein n=1 Tax=Scheffersomyces xylosifermentans TaxID=1304137 RepID=UPI00315CF539